MKNRPVLLAFTVILGLVLAFITVRHLTAPKKPSGGWYQGGPYTLTIRNTGGISGMTREWIQISNQPSETNRLAASSVQVFVSGRSADQIVHLLNQHDIDQWGHEAHGAGMDMLYSDANLTYLGKDYHWDWHGSPTPMGPPPRPSLFIQAKRLIVKPKYPTPYTRDMNNLYHSILQIMRNNTNDLIIMPHWRTTNSQTKP